MNAATTGHHSPTWTWPIAPIAISGSLILCAMAGLLSVSLALAASGGTTVGPDVRAEPAPPPTLAPRA